MAAPSNRAGLLSTYLVIGYVGTILPILGLGALSDHIGLTRALVAFCCAFALLTLALCWMAWRTTPIDARSH